MTSMLPRTFFLKHSPINLISRLMRMLNLDFFKLETRFHWHQDVMVDTDIHMMVKQSICLQEFTVATINSDGLLPAFSLRNCLSRFVALIFDWHTPISQQFRSPYNFYTIMENMHITESFRELVSRVQAVRACKFSLILNWFLLQLSPWFAWCTIVGETPCLEWNMKFPMYY